MLACWRAGVLVLLYRYVDAVLKGTSALGYSGCRLCATALSLREEEGKIGRRRQDREARLGCGGPQARQAGRLRCHWQRGRARATCSRGSLNVARATPVPAATSCSLLAIWRPCSCYLDLHFQRHTGAISSLAERRPCPLRVSYPWCASFGP